MFLKFLYRDYKLKFFEIYRYLIKQMVNLKCDVSYLWDENFIKII